MPIKKEIFIFLFSLSCCVLFNEINRYFVKKNNPENRQINGRSTVYGSTIWSIDNFWYLTQPKNYLDGKGFVLEPAQSFTAVRRTPGYPIFYLIHLAIFGEKNAHKIIPYTQAILFALSALVLALAVCNFTHNSRIALLSGIVYGCNPFTIGAVYYTITESIHPAFVIFGAYFFSKALKKDNIRDWWLTGLFFSIATLIRPLNGLLLPAGVLAIFFLPKILLRDKIRKALVVSLGFFLLMIPWAIRNYLVTHGDLVVLEKFYHEDPMNMGKKQTYLSKWWMCWGNPRQESFIDSLESEIAGGRNGYINKYVNELPPYAFRGYTKNELSTTLQAYKDCIKNEMDRGVYRKYFNPQDSLPICEEEMKQRFSALVRKYRKEDPFRYYVISPLIIRGKEIVLISFASMYGSLKPDDGNFNLAQIIIKSIMFAMNVGAYLGFFFFLFFVRTNLVLKIFMSLFVISTFLYVVYNTHIEARYMLAAYPFLFVGTVMSIYHCVQRIISGRTLDSSQWAN